MTESGQERRNGGEQEQPVATSSAKCKVEETGVDLSQMEGSGTQGCITVKDVRGAANQ